MSKNTTKQQPTIYLSQYFTPEGALNVSFYRLFLDSLLLIKDTKDPNTQQILYNQTIDLLGLIDSPSVVAMAKEDLQAFFTANPDIKLKYSREIENEIIDDDFDEPEDEEAEE